MAQTMQGLGADVVGVNCALGPAGTFSVIEGMSTSQLSSLAIFGTVQTFKQGHAIFVQDDEANGFYILLSGHLTVGIEGQIVAELSEGDVFGELGLVEGGSRESDVTVVSAHASGC